MNLDNETWLIEEGAKIIEKKSSEGFNSLSSLEKAVYDFWVIDYSVRNSGTLVPMRELSENSISRLKEFAEDNNFHYLYSILKLANDENTFCKTYYQSFDNACKELRYFDKNGN
ncbi:MAG TPA: hypothetical protein VN843_21220 [Anaerolineales bacterium]|nr:hypothetical protein [Anaerolineales bacterium]